MPTDTTLLTDTILLMLTEDIGNTLLITSCLIIGIVLCKAYAIVMYVPTRGWVFGMPYAIHSSYRKKVATLTEVDISYKSARKYALNFPCFENTENGMRHLVFLINISKYRDTKVLQVVEVYERPNNMVFIRLVSPYTYQFYNKAPSELKTAISKASFSNLFT